MEIYAPFYFNTARHLNFAKSKFPFSSLARQLMAHVLTDGHICHRKQCMASKGLNVAAECLMQVSRSLQGPGWISNIA